jgi:hypothetical protein
MTARADGIYIEGRAKEMSNGCYEYKKRAFAFPGSHSDYNLFNHDYIF